MGTLRRELATREGDPEAVSVAAVAGALERLEGPRRDAGRALLDALAKVLR